MPETLFEKVWKRHEVVVRDQATLLYIDRHLIHEVTSPQAFDGLRLAGRKVRRPDLTFATLDHNVPTENQLDIREPMSRRQVETLRANCKEFGLTLYDMGSGHQGIVHVIGPELGLTLPGTTIVCGDSHTSTHGAFGALAFGIGTSEVEHVLATQTLWQGARPHALGVEVTGQLPPGLEPKDIILAVIRAIGTGGGTGHVLEYYGPAIRALSMEGRMTVCNMSIEAGARAGLIAPDDTTYQYIAAGDRPFAPKAAAFDAAVADWRKLATEDASAYDRHVSLDASKLVPQVTWGTNPAMTIDVTGRIPEPEDVPFASRDDARRALEYMGLTPGTPVSEIPIDVVFIGSCTNGRIEDLRVAAHVLRGRKVAPGVRTLVVPGSEEVRHQAIAEGLDVIFSESGAEWRQAGCSMCLAMNPDKLTPGQRSASTSNRNFEGPPGARRPDPPAQPRDGRRRRRRRPLHRRPHPPGGRPLMEPFVTHRGRLALLNWSDVNTDLIIPARYLKRVERTGYGPLLFADKRYVPGGSPAADDPETRGADAPDFPLNAPEAPRRHHPGRRPQLRLRLQPRARRLGRRPGRLPRRDRPGQGRRLRRHLRGQRLQQRPAAHRAARGRLEGPGRRLPRRGHHRPPRRHDHPPPRLRRRRGRRSPSTSPRPSGTGSSTASTPSPETLLDEPAIASYESAAPAWALARS